MEGSRRVYISWDTRKNTTFDGLYPYFNAFSTKVGGSITDDDYYIPMSGRDSIKYMYEFYNAVEKWVDEMNEEFRADLFDENLEC
jgi:hypothetical protein